MNGLLGKASAILLLLSIVTSSVCSAPAGNSSSSEESEEEVPEPIVLELEEDITEDTVLEASLERFLDLVPSDRIRNVTAEAYLASEAVREAFNFLRSREFLNAKDKLLESPEAQEFVKFLNQSGLNVARFVRKVSNRTGIPVPNLNNEEADFSGSSEEEGAEAATVVSQLVDKVLTELPQEQFFAVFFEKMESDTEFSEFVERLNGDEFEAILIKIQVKMCDCAGVWSETLIVHCLVYRCRNLRRWTSSRSRCWTTI